MQRIYLKMKNMKYRQEKTPKMISMNLMKKKKFKGLLLMNHMKKNKFKGLILKNHRVKKSCRKRI